MAKALVRTSTLAVKKEATYGAIPTYAAADVLSLWGEPNFNSRFDPIEDMTLFNSLSKRGTLRGAETTDGDVSIPFKPSGTAGTAPDTDVLYECGVGAKNVSTASTTTTGSTVSIIELVASGGAGFAVGDAVLIDPLGGSAYEVVWITSIATDSLTVSPDMSSAPGSGVDVRAGVHYKLSSARSSFGARFWRGDLVREDYLGNVVQTMELEFVAGQLPVPKFTFQGQTLNSPVTEAYGLGATSLDADDPLVARNMTIEVGGASYPVANIAIAINFDIFRNVVCTGSGTEDIILTGRMCTGSFSLLYEDKTIEDDFRADTENEVRIVAGSVAGKMFAARIPKMRYTETPKSVESGIYKYDTAFDCKPTTVGEDEVTSFSWL
jgi:hypothetical protein